MNDSAKDMLMLMLMLRQKHDATAESRMLVVVVLMQLLAHDACGPCTAAVCNTLRCLQQPLHTQGIHVYICKWRTCAVLLRAGEHGCAC